MKIETLTNRLLRHLLFFALAVSYLKYSYADPDSGGNPRPSVVYPKVYYRGPEYGGMHCVDSSESDQPRELFMIRGLTVTDLFDKGEKRYAGSVAEFFSGKRYKAQLVNLGSDQVNLIAQNKNIRLTCAIGNTAWILGHSSPFNAQGEYLDWEMVDAQTGFWGNISLGTNNSCVTTVGVEDCDVGLQGFGRRRADGAIIWASLLVAARPYPPSYPGKLLPDAFEILDANWDGTWLGDGTALFTIGYPGWYGQTVRIDMNKGRLFENHPDVAMVPMEDWAALKHVLWQRWFGATNPCGRLSEKDASVCNRKVNELYASAQTNYLFPMYSYSHKK